MVFIDLKKVYGRVFTQGPLVGVGEERDLYFKYINAIKDMNEGAITSMKTLISDT